MLFLVWIIKWAILLHNYFEYACQHKLKAVLKLAAYVYKPLIVHYFPVSRVYPTPQELWIQQFYWYKRNTVTVTSFVSRWKESFYLFYVPFSLVLLSPCFHMNCPFMEFCLQRVTDICNRFYIHNWNRKWEQVLQTVSPLMFKTFHSHLYTWWCRKWVLSKQYAVCRLPSASDTATPCSVPANCNSRWNNLPGLRQIPLWGVFFFLSCIYFLTAIFFNYIYLASIVSKMLNTVLPSLVFCSCPNFLFCG